MMRITITLLLFLFSMGCTAPRGALVSSEIYGNSGTASISGLNYHLVTRVNVSTDLKEHALDPINSEKIPLRREKYDVKMAEGDMIDVQIWDSSSNSLLTSDGQMSTTLQNIAIPKSGIVFFPYIGNVQIGHFTPEEMRKELQALYTQYSPSIQVQVAWHPGLNNSVQIISQKSGSTVMGMKIDNLSISSVLAASSGALSNFRNPIIVLRRHNVDTQIFYNDLVSDETFDLKLIPKDKLFIMEDARSFSVLGASGTQAQIDFNKKYLSVIEAATMAGGFDEDRANLEGIFVLRNNVSPNNDKNDIFAFDLTSASGLFAAKSFHIRNGDLLYITESPITTLDRVIVVAGRIFGITSRL